MLQNLGGLDYICTSESLHHNIIPKQSPFGLISLKLSAIVTPCHPFSRQLCHLPLFTSGRWFEFLSVTVTLSTPKAPSCNVGGKTPGIAEGLLLILSQIISPPTEYSPEYTQHLPCSMRDNPCRFAIDPLPPPSPTNPTALMLGIFVNGFPLISKHSMPQRKNTIWHTHARHEDTSFFAYFQGALHLLGAKKKQCTRTS